MLRLGDDVLGLGLCLLCWPPRPPAPAWACWGWRALATRLAPVTCPWPWEGGSPRAGCPPPPLLRGCQLAICPPPPPTALRWGLRFGWRRRCRCGRPVLCQFQAGTAGVGVWECSFTCLLRVGEAAPLRRGGSRSCVLGFHTVKCDSCLVGDGWERTARRGSAGLMPRPHPRGCGTLTSCLSAFSCSCVCAFVVLLKHDGAPTAGESNYPATSHHDVAAPHASGGAFVPPYEPNQPQSHPCRAPQHNNNCPNSNCTTNVTPMMPPASMWVTASSTIVFLHSTFTT